MSKCEKIKSDGFFNTKTPRKSPLILFMAYDKQDNNKFVAKITKAVIELDAENKKISPMNLSRATGYPIREIELNLYDIEVIMDGLGIE